MAKKRLVLVSIILIVIAVIITAICTVKFQRLSFDAENVESVSLRKGETGEGIEITDAETINDIISRINDMQLTRTKWQPRYSGYSVMLNIQMRNGKSISLDIKDDCIIRGRFRWGTDSECKDLQKNLLSMFERSSVARWDVKPY